MLLNFHLTNYRWCFISVKNLKFTSTYNKLSLDENTINHFLESMFFRCLLFVVFPTKFSTSFAPLIPLLCYVMSGTKEALSLNPFSFFFCFKSFALSFSFFESRTINLFVSNFTSLNYILHFLQSTTTSEDICKRKKYSFLKQLLHWVSVPLLSIIVNRDLKQIIQIFTHTVSIMRELFVIIVNRDFKQIIQISSHVVSNMRELFVIIDRWRYWGNNKVGSFFLIFSSPFYQLYICLFFFFSSSWLFIRLSVMELFSCLYICIDDSSQGMFVLVHLSYCPWGIINLFVAFFCLCIHLRN